MGGLIPLTWQELHAFRIETGAIGPGWEPETLMEMSRAYCVEIGKASDPFRISPMDRALAQKAKNSDIAGEPVT